MEENELVGEFKDNKPTQNILQIMDEKRDISSLPIIYSVRVPNCWWASNDNDAW
jgi:hypothetical protein